MSGPTRNGESGQSDRDEQSIEQLLQGVGKRDLPSDSVAEQVRQAVHAEWRELVEQRQRRSRFLSYAMAAGVAAVVLTVALSLRFNSVSAVPVASVARVEGVLQVDPAGSGDWRAVAAGAQVATGDTLRTDEGTLVALDFGHGVSMRVAAGSLLEIAAADRVVLDRGTVYVDADPRVAKGQALVIGTPYGSVHHLGTQYSVSTTRAGIALSVREGRVEITRESGTHVAEAGEHLEIPSSGEVTRSSIAPQDASWHWATRIAPAFSIDHQPLTSFLAWVGRETGKAVYYASDDIQAQAAGVILRGSAGDLAPEQALAAVLATTSFVHTETDSAIEIRALPTK
jgi:ferric-dicitrate binding protein FerR (iron transport regulator)